MRLAVFLDGTWADPADNSNVWQLYLRTPVNADQATFYERGVGSRPGEGLAGGLFGWGLRRQIVTAYEFLATMYTPGDTLFLIGFSRGATAARSLGGMITHNGLVHPAVLPPERVYARYRNRTDFPGLLEMRTGERTPTCGDDEVLLESSRGVRIHFTGVFDTVGSLGVPGGPPGRLAGRYRFHDRQLSGLNDRAFQALAVDEFRPDFTATMWEGEPPLRRWYPGDGPEPGAAERVEVGQRWYAGAHGNVGGGGSERVAETNPLSLIPREWIAAKAGEAGLEIASPATPPTGREWRGRVSDSHGDFLHGLYRLVRRRRQRPLGRQSTEQAAPTLRTRATEIPAYVAGRPAVRAFLGIP